VSFWDAIGGEEKPYSVGKELGIDRCRDREII
jgi:hypothetical protein